MVKVISVYARASLQAKEIGFYTNNAFYAEYVSYKLNENIYLQINLNIKLRIQMQLYIIGSHNLLGCLFKHA